MEFLATANKKGFTLIELSISLVLLATLLFLTGVHSRFLNRLLVRAELECLYSTCYFLQQQAIISGEDQKLVFIPSSNTYSFNNQTRSLAQHVIFGTVSGAKGPPSKAENSIQSPISFKDNNLTFYPDGIIASGTIYLTDRLRQYGYALSSGVSHMSYLRKYQYTGNQWQPLS